MTVVLVHRHHSVLIDHRHRSVLIDNCHHINNSTVDRDVVWQRLFLTVDGIGGMVEAGIDGLPLSVFRFYLYCNVFVPGSPLWGV